MTVIAVDTTDEHVPLPTGRAAPASAVWVRVRPNIRRTHTVATDVLAALGKRRDVAGKGRNEHEDIRLAAAWLRAYDTADLVLVDAQHLGSLVLRNVVRLAEAAGVDLWLLHRPPTSDIFTRALARHARAIKTLHDVPAPLCHAGTSRPRADFPQVPRHDIHQFRAAVEAFLPGPAREAVLDCLDGTALAAHSRMAVNGASKATVAEIIDDLLLDGPGDDQLITRIRGVQLAAWHHDIFARVDLNTLLNSEERPTLPADAVEDALVAYRQPHRILTVALTRRGHSLNAIAGLRRSDALDGARLRIGNKTETLQDEVARAARAALDLTADNHGDDRLIPLALQSIAAVLTDATKDLGLHVKGRRAERTRPGHNAFLSRLGITLRALP